MTERLTVPVPGDVMKRFQVLAEHECRTPEGQMLWLIKSALYEADRRRGRRGRSTPEERARAMLPLAEELRLQRVAAGSPSTREIAKRSEGLSHTAIHTALRGQHIPSWPTLKRIVTALDGPVEHFRDLWLQVQQDLLDSAQTEEAPPLRDQRPPMCS